jgi:hypothetical protein
MQKAKAIRLAGFVGALGASAVLIGAAVQGTGAYFTDSHNGSMTATTGHVSVAVAPADGQLNFTGMLPGDYQSKNVDYVAQGTGAEDIWLVFPTNGSAEAFVGSAGDAAGGGLGRYGHFELSSTNGAYFTSYNLNNPAPGGTKCPIDANGHGGSNAQPTSPSDTTTANYCAPANAILLASGLTNGQGGTATFTFGFTPLLRNASQQDSLQASVAYKVVATQAGIRPDNQFNP